MRIQKLHLTMRQKVLFGRIRAGAWIFIGIISFIFGWESSVPLIWIASFYANAESGFATGEAADDGVVMKELREQRKILEDIQKKLAAGTPNE